jgi:hypothetical protein
MSTFSCIVPYPPRILASRAGRRRSEARTRQTIEARARKSLRRIRDKCLSPKLWPRTSLDLHLALPIASTPFSLLGMTPHSNSRNPSPPPASHKSSTSPCLSSLRIRSCFIPPSPCPPVLALQFLLSSLAFRVQLRLHPRPVFIHSYTTPQW